MSEQESGMPANDELKEALANAAEEELTIGQERVVELLSYIVVNLVEHPDDVLIDIMHQDGRDLYRVKVHADDLGRMIGKGGQTARALRTLLLAVSAKTDQRLGLEIVE